MSTSFSEQRGAPVSATQEVRRINKTGQESLSFMQAVSNESDYMDLVAIFNKFMKKANDTSESSV